MEVPSRWPCFWHNAVRRSGISRADIFITTKVHNLDQGFDATLRGFDKSMRKIKCDYIDLYLVHWPIQGKRKETWLALERLFAEKRVRSIGVANYLPPFLDELDGYASVVPAVDQVEFSPYLFLDTLMHRCQGQGTVLQAYTPLLRGLRFKDPKLVALAEKYGKTPAQVILRWVLQHGVSAIPKSANQARLRENFNVFDFDISANDMGLMDTWNEGLRVVDDPMDML